MDKVVMPLLLRERKMRASTLMIVSYWRSCTRRKQEENKLGRSWKTFLVVNVIVLSGGKNRQRMQEEKRGRKGKGGREDNDCTYNTVFLLTNIFPGD